MDDETARTLDRLNADFYRRHARAFSAKRDRPWRGWSRLLEWLPERPLAVLDLGCGNGRFGRFLAEHRPLARYDGVDASGPLLSIARAAAPRAEACGWHEVDFVEAPGALPERRYDLVALFGVLHGVAGEVRRQRLVANACERLAPDALLAFTCWRFTEDARIRDRIDAASAGPLPVEASALGPREHLIPWSEESGVYRYGVQIGAAERRRWLDAESLREVDAYRDDGPAGDLNHYTLARRALPEPGARG